MTQEALKLALEALEANYLLVNGTETHGGLEQCLDGYYSSCFDTDPINKQTEEAITAIKEALAQTQEPDDIASILACRDMLDAQPVSEADRVIWPERTWVGLTDEDMKGMSYGDKVLAAWVARTLKEKNT
jgi:hypothetical protein